MDDPINLVSNLNEIHTTVLGIQRIRRNLCLETTDVVSWCKDKIIDKHSIITRRGKNWYIENDTCIITVNAFSYTIITAHLLKKNINQREK